MVIMTKIKLLRNNSQFIESNRNALAHMLHYLELWRNVVAELVLCRLREVLFVFLKHIK